SDPVPKGRFELPRVYTHYALNVARLPVPPLRRGAPDGVRLGSRPGDSNPGPAVYETAALPTELGRHASTPNSGAYKVYHRAGTRRNPHWHLTGGIGAESTALTPFLGQAVGNARESRYGIVARCTARRYRGQQGDRTRNGMSQEDVEAPWRNADRSHRGRGRQPTPSARFVAGLDG
ncbi:MAG: hypothetical protein QOF01_43, partial [Thermomicrobiales bacterium]|nr:hypothetical protein [Thermomicrobiales bacterium]